MTNEEGSLESGEVWSLESGVWSLEKFSDGDASLSNGSSLIG